MLKGMTLAAVILLPWSIKKFHNLELTKVNILSKPFGPFEFADITDSFAFPHTIEVFATKPLSNRVYFTLRSSRSLKVCCRKSVALVEE
ncbi:hypothetical protein SAMN04487970_103258 [Paenibacillus tianmuensis]|uniref:Uncharacterized protein n=1 Tax=Paenibacillus tianmuensis TaxID=624147 RepID=A0A1G4SQC2_9BACL|nr:hypothetical protein SAMN04487970_103258 [Paenibacillus tianmuensis]